MGILLPKIGRSLARDRSDARRVHQIDQVLAARRRIVPLHIPILMTLGNHEYYRSFIPEELARQHTIQAAQDTL